MNAEQKISAVLEKELDAVDKDCIRPLQVRAFECCARCCRDQLSSQSVLENCLQNCKRPVRESEERLKMEVDNLQGRLTRCAQQCQDMVMDKLSSNPTQEEREIAKQQAEACLLKCADDNIPHISKIIQRFRQQLDSCS